MQGECPAKLWSLWLVFLYLYLNCHEVKVILTIFGPWYKYTKYTTHYFFSIRWGFYVLVQICLEISCYENIWWVSLFVLPSKFRFSWETTMWTVPGMEFFTKWFNNLEHYEKHIKKKPSKTGTLFSSKRVPLSSNRKGSDQIRSVSQ